MTDNSEPAAAQRQTHPAQQSTVSRRTNHAQSLSIQTPNGQLTVSAIAPGALRVRCAPRLRYDPYDLVLIHCEDDVPTTAREVSDHIQLSTSRISATFDKQSGVLGFADAQGHRYLEEAFEGQRVSPSVIQDQPTLTAEVSFHLTEDEKLFGLGQFQDGFLDIRDLPRRLTQVNTQIAIPFMVSSKGYGVLWNNHGLTDFNPADNHLVLEAGRAGEANTKNVTTAEGTREMTHTAQTFTADLVVPSSGRYAMMLDIGQDMSRRFQVVIDGVTVMDVANTWLPPTTSWFWDLEAGSHSIWVQGSTDDKPVLYWRGTEPRTRFRSPVSDGVDYVVFAGPSIDEVIATYRRLTGQAPLMPLWAYGFIQCRERYSSSEHLIDTVKEFRRRNLPLDVIVQDWMYWGKYGWNAMQWDENHYPDPAMLVRQLHSLDARLMVSVWSKIAPYCDVGRELTEKNLYISGTEWIDFFNPEARVVYWKNFSTRMLSLGIDAWWLDGTEPENDALKGAMTFAGPGERFRLMYPLLVNQTVYDGQRRDAPDRRVFILTRSAFLGQQRYASSTWSGDVGNDWETMRRQVTAGLSYSISGLPYWTTDTGGFFRPGNAQYTDETYHERYIRWLQFSTFTPLLRVHGYETETEPWHFGDQVVGIQRTYLELRYSLIPYIYSIAAQVTFTGSTLMRPLVMDFPHDEKALDQNYEYMFGPAFLVAPVLEPAVAEWQVYAPVAPVGWYDWWSEQQIPSGKNIVVDAPLGRLPLLVKAGSIVPLGPKIQHTGQESSSGWEIRVYPGQNASFDLYEDDGTSYRYEQGCSSTTALKWEDCSKTFSMGQRKGQFPSMISTRSYRVCLAGSRAAAMDVVYSGEPIAVTFPPGA